MNVHLQRTIDRYVGVPLCALASLVERLRFGSAAQPFLPRRIVVILLSEMGSLVLAQPMFALLRARYPEASLHVLLFGKNREVLDLMASVPRGVSTLNASPSSEYSMFRARTSAGLSMP